MADIGGVDVQKLLLAVEAQGTEEFESKVEEAIRATIKLSGAMDENMDAGVRLEKGVKTITSALKAQLGVLAEAEREKSRVAKAAKELAKIEEQATDASNAFVMKVHEMAETLGMSRTQLLRYQSAMHGVEEETRSAIATIERYNQAQSNRKAGAAAHEANQKRLIDEIAANKRAAEERKAIQERRDMEMQQSRWQAEKEETAAIERMIAADEQAAKQRKAIQEKRDMEMHLSREKQRADYQAFWDGVVKAEDAAAAKQKEIQQRRDVEMYNLAAKQAQKKEELVRRVGQSNKVAVDRIVKQAEKQAIDEINWTKMSVRQRISELERLKSYQSDPRITTATTKSSFNSAAFKDLPNLDGYVKSAERAEAANARLAQSKQRLTGVVGQLRTAFAGWIALASATTVIRTIDEYTKFNAQLKLATHSAGEFATATADVNRIARISQISLSQTGNLYARIQRSTEDLGLSQQHVADITESVTLALRSGGATATETASVMLQLSQSFASGRLNGQEFMAVSEAGPRLMKALADGIGMPVGALKVMSAEGKLTAEMMAIALPKALEELRKEAEKVRTISSSFDVLKNSIMQMIGATADESGFIRGFTDMVLKLADNLRTVVAVIGSLMAIGLAVWLNSAVAGMIALGTAATATATGVGATALAVRGLGAAIKSLFGPIGIITSLLGMGWVAWSAYADKAEAANKKTVDSTKNATNDVIEALDRQIAKLKERNRISREGYGELPVQETGGSLRVKEIDKETALQMQRAANGSAHQREVAHARVRELAEERLQIVTRLSEYTKHQEEATQISREKAHTEFLRQYETKEERLARTIKEIREKLGRDLTEAELKRVHDQIMPKGGGRTKQTKDEAGAYRTLASSIRSKIEENMLEMQIDEKASQYQKMHIKYLNDVALGRIKLTPLQRADIEAGFRELEQTEEKLRLAKEEKAFYEEVEKEKRKAAEAQLSAAETSALAQERLAEALGMTESQMLAVETAKLRDQLATESVSGAMTAEMATLMELIELKEREMHARKQVEDYKAGEQAKKNLESFFADSEASFGDVLADGFGRAGEALGDLIGMLRVYGEEEKKIAKVKEDAVTKMLANGSSQAELEEELGRINRADASNRLKNYGNMANAAKGFFSENSRGYKAMEAAAKVFHVAQVAMNMVEIMLLAKKAVLNQGNGDPYSAFARMAAMAAVVVGLGVAIGGVGGGSGGNRKTAEERQKEQGAGGVFGDPEAKSDSIAKALERLKDNSDMTMPVSLAMLASLRSIDGSMAGLARVLMRMQGISTGSGFGTHEGTVKKSLGGLLGKTVQSITDSGFYFNAGSMKDYIEGNVGISQYEEVKKTKKRTFRSDKVSYSMNYKDADPGIADFYADVFGNAFDAIDGASELLGYGKNFATNNLENFKWTGGHLSLRGMSPEEQRTAIQEDVNWKLDSYTEWLFDGALDGFTKLNEEFLTTVVRISNGIEEADSVLARYNIRAIKYTEIVNQQGDVAAEIVRQSVIGQEKHKGLRDIMATLNGSAEELMNTYSKLTAAQRAMANTGLKGDLTARTVQGAGGLGNLGNSLETFRDKYFTDEERARMMRNNMTEDFRKLGRSLPKTREEYRKMVQGINTSTESGQKLQGQLLGLAGGFDELMSITEKVESATTKLKDAWDDITKSLLEAARKIRGELGADSVVSAQSEFDKYTALARQGDEDAANKLPALAEAVIAAGSATATTALEIARIRALTASSLEQTARFTDQFGKALPNYEKQAETATNSFFGGYTPPASGNNPQQNAPVNSLSNATAPVILTGNLEGEIRALRNEFISFKSESKVQQEKIVLNTGKIEKTLTRNDTGNGLLTTQTV